MLIPLHLLLLLAPLTSSLTLSKSSLTPLTSLWDTEIYRYVFMLKTHSTHISRKRKHALTRPAGFQIVSVIATWNIRWCEIGWYIDLWTIQPLPSHITAPLTRLLPLLTRIAAPAHPPATTYWSFMRLWLFKTRVCKGEKTVKYTIFTAYSRHALTACFWHRIIHNVNAIRWNCYMNMSEAYQLRFS